MMMNRKQQIRTYQRKTAKKPFVNSLAQSIVSIKKINLMENDHFNKSGTLDSFNYDLFETTFDRLAKGAVVPPMPLDTNQNVSWDDSSSNSDINNTTNVKSSKHRISNLYAYNNIPNLSPTSVKLTSKRKRTPRYKSEIAIPKKILSTKTKVTLKNKTQSGKAQDWKKQRNKIQKEKTQYKFKKSGCKYSEQISHANFDTINNFKDTTHEDISHTKDKYMHQNILNIDKAMTFQTGLIGTNDSIADSKYMSSYHKNIKPCFVELNACTVGNYIVNHEKTVRDEQSISHNVKVLCTDTLHVAKDISKINNAISQSILSEGNITESFKHMSIKQCSVALCDSAIKDWYVSKNKKSINYCIDMREESNFSHIASNNSKTAPYYNNKVEPVLYDTKRNKRDLIKDSFVKVERLKIEKFAIENDTIFNKKEQHIVSSTPIGKRTRSSTCSALFSPINTNAHDTLHLKSKCTKITEKKDIPDIVLPDKLSDYEDSRSSIVLLECCKFDAIDMQEQQKQILQLSQKSKTVINSTFKTETVPSPDEIYAVLPQKYNTECDIEMKFPHHSLKISTASTDQSLSLFDDTTYNYIHSSKDTVGNKIEKCFTDALACESVKADSVNSSVECLKQNQLLNDNARIDTSSIYISSCRKQEYESEVQENAGTDINIMEAEFCENSEDQIVKHNFLGKNQENINITDLRVLLTRLQDPIRITGKRMHYPKWHLSMSNISKSLNNETTQLENKIFDYVINNETSNIQSKVHSKNVVNLSLESFNNSIQQNNDTNKRIEKSVFLKPGKYWARSLSILNNINNVSNLDKLGIGKGKRWSRSVRDILDMQKQGIFQTCLKKGKNDTNLSCEDLDASNVSFDSNKCKTFSSTNHARFSKRISVRVVLNNTSIKCDVKDAPFLEAFGITAEESPILKLYRKESLIRDNPIIKRHSATARDVVLQRCSQDSYISFLNCFPDSYLKNCRKIGEGVYGEVFLHEYNNKKSVIKIIPIEGEQLINGEPQKKFSEILSEIVIAKELDNLRLNATYKTSGFVEVRSISCIIGRYPQRLIELWNIYDDDKTSDNDCPSMFDENQLYVALELGHGGEDLEAFIFQTADEACTLFLQTALALAVAEKALEFEHRDLHWGNILISRTNEPYVYYNLGGKEIKFPSNGVKVSIIDFTLSRMLYQGCCIYNDLALDPALFTAHGEYQFEIYRLMRDKIQNNWRNFEPYTNILWLHYTLDKMITAVRYRKKNLKAHKHAIIRLKEFKDTILNYDSAFDFIINSNSVVCL